jgi:hypothetical protein
MAEKFQIVLGIISSVILGYVETAVSRLCGMCTYIYIFQNIPFSACSFFGGQTILSELFYLEL